MTVRVDHEALRRFVTRIYANGGMPGRDASLMADTLVQADLWGHQSHGVLRTSWYLARLESGVMKAVTELAARDLIRRAKAHGVAAIAVRNSNHFGTCMYWTKIGAEAGCVMMLMTNGGAAIAPWGGKKKIIGTNPWSYAAPAGKLPPLLVDMAITGVARGKIYLARQRHEKIPLGWALTADGAPTTDPQEAIDGIILPMAGHKGYAIGVVVDMLAGVLSGSAFLEAVNGPYKTDKKSGAGHFMAAFDISKFQPLAEFEQRMEEFIAEIKAVPLAQEVEEIFYPGEMEARADERQRREGLELPEDTIADLERIALETGIEFERQAS